MLMHGHVLCSASNKLLRSGLEWKIVSTAVFDFAGGYSEGGSTPLVEDNLLTGGRKFWYGVNFDSQ